jgi:uncharacterized membrane protein YkoI
LNGSHVYEVEIDTGKKNGDDDDDVTVYVDAVTGKVKEPLTADDWE